MKRLFFIMLLSSIILCGCSKSSKDNIIKDLSNKISNMSAYEIKGLLSISNNEDTYNYDVSVAFKENDNYRVSIINKSNNHEQIILKSNDEVYVITPSLNKSFKFQSNWPLNNSQIYILKSILNDINNDTTKIVEENDDGYIITTKVNYPNNIDLVKQEIYLDKNATIKKIDVINNNGIIEMTMSFNEINENPSFKDDYFNLDSIISNIDVKDENTSLSIDNVVYPLYVPTGTSLSHEEKIAKENGERVILTFDGEKPFLLVEETANIDKDFSIVPIFGEPSFLNDTLGAITDNSLSWTSGGIDYYIVSDVMGKIELIEIANSINAIPIMK